MGMRVFLTGVSGYLGGVLARWLSAEPEIECITGLDRVPPPAPLPPRVEFLPMDMRSPDLLAAMAGHDIVVHTAFTVIWPHSMPRAERDDNNLNGVRNVARAAAANRVRRFVQASSVAAYAPLALRDRDDIGEDTPIGAGDSFFYYTNGKALAERSLAEILGPTGTVLTLLRPSYIIGPCNRATIAGFRAAAANVRGHDGRVQYVHEDDVAAAFVRAVRSDLPGAFNVVPDDFMRLSQVWDIVGLTNVPTVPFWLAYAITAFRWRFLGAESHSSWVRAIAGNVTFSNARLRATGWHPRFHSADALRTAL